MEKGELKTLQVQIERRSDGMFQVATLWDGKLIEAVGARLAPCLTTLGQKIEEEERACEAKRL